MNEITITVAGQLTDRPKLAYTTDAKPVANFTVAANSSYRGNDGTWHDREPVFMSCAVWGEQAERVATLNKGDRIIATGRLESRSFTPAESDRPVRRFELTVSEIAVSLLRAAVQVTKAKRDGATT